MPADRPSVYTIPPHVAFVDALAMGLLDRTRGDPMRLARATVLLPSPRSVRALTDAFVRLSETRGLLLPRMTPIGGLDEDDADEMLGTFANDFGADIELPPEADDWKQRLVLVPLVKRYLETDGNGTTVVEALRLADLLRKALRALQREGVEPERLVSLDVGDLATHWEKTLRYVGIIANAWPNILMEEGEIDAAARNNALIERLAQQLHNEPPSNLIVAAGMVGTSPVVGQLLHRIARLPGGMVVLPGLDVEMDDEEWQEIRCHLADPERSPAHDSEGHPQFAFRCLLERMKVGRGEIAVWPYTTPYDGPPARTAVLARAMAPARFTDAWRDLDLADDALAGVRLIEAATPGEEAQVIALAMREALGTPGRTAALVTPDRGLARRVAAHLARWDVTLDDSAGVPLRQTPPGTFMLALVEAAVQQFAPTPLLALLKHPLVRTGGRLDWLDRARQLDVVLRGVRPPPGLDPVGAQIQDAIRDARTDEQRQALLRLGHWWDEVAGILEELEKLFAKPTVSLPDLIDKLRAAAADLTGDELWRGPAGRALAGLVEQLELHGHRLDPFDPPDAPGLLSAFFQETAVRPPFGRHPRLSVYGLLEARLQRADLMILGGLNEGVWPSLSQPDPWLAPAARAQLGLPGLERRIGLAAHDFVQAMGAQQVIATRARRDATAPTVASRFWLRLEALGGERVMREHALLGIARALDAPDGPPRYARRPEPRPPADLRPRALSVTQAEKLKADPYSFYAETMLGLRRLQALDEDPTAAEKGTFLHSVLERWIKERPDDPAHLVALARHMLAEWDHHPLMKALWAPRALRAVEWAAGAMAEWTAEGWRPALAEARGEALLKNGIKLTGKADRIDVAAEGSLAIVDYKTGMPPSHAQLEGGYALQLGLLGWLAQEGHVPGLAPGEVAALRYWRLSGGSIAGKVSDPLVFNRRDWSDPPRFIAESMVHLDRLCAELLLGDAPFTAKLHPDYSTRYKDHDHLARVAEWMGRSE